MINLKIQIISLLYSFLFGFAFSLFLFFNKKIIYNKYTIIKLFGTFSIITISSIIYFYGLQMIDNSFFHSYHLIMIIFGFILNRFILKIVKIKKK